jgi:hypothetical protein
MFQRAGWRLVLPDVLKHDSILWRLKEAQAAVKPCLRDVPMKFDLAFTALASFEDELLE